MKTSWTFATPKNLILGSGAADDLGSHLDQREPANIFVVIDPQVAFTPKGKNILNKIQQKHQVFSSFTTNPTTNHVDAAAALFRKQTPDAVIAIGGGSAIDLAKATMLVGLNGGKIADYLAGKKGRKKFPFFIAAPTTCGTGSEASPYAVITDPVRKRKRGIENLSFLPDLVILDPEFLQSLGNDLIAATGIDALTHILESYISKKANPLTRLSAQGLLLSFKHNLEKAALKKDPLGLESLLYRAFSSRLLYPRTGLTIAHALSHPLGAHTGLHHGHAVSFFLPQSLKFNYPSCPDVLKSLLQTMGFKSDTEFYDWFSNFTEQTGIRKNIQKLLREKTTPIAIIARDAMESSNIPSNPRPVDLAALTEIVKKSKDVTL